MIDRSEFKRVAEKALIQAAEDAAKFGIGYVSISQSGEVKRLDPRGTFLEPPTKEDGK